MHKQVLQNQRYFELLFHRIVFTIILACSLDNLATRSLFVSYFDVLRCLPDARNLGNESSENTARETFPLRVRSRFDFQSKANLVIRFVNY